MDCEFPTEESVPPPPCPSPAVLPPRSCLPHPKKKYLKADIHSNILWRRYFAFCNNISFFLSAHILYIQSLSISHTEGAGTISSAEYTTCSRMLQDNMYSIVERKCRSNMENAYCRIYRSEGSGHLLVSGHSPRNRLFWNVLCRRQFAPLLRSLNPLLNRRSK